MNLKLTRISEEKYGIFGVLSEDAGAVLGVTLEHAYDSGLGDGSFTAKIPSGFYTCKRSMHQLHGMQKPFETFQVMDVPGHTNILLHWGNYNKDSDGCILIGKTIDHSDNGTMITESKKAFADLMELQKDIDTFNLEIA